MTRSEHNISTDYLGLLNQTYHYFKAYSDGISLKLTVITVSGFEMLHVSFSIHAVYHYLITDYFSPLSLLHNVWSINILFGVIVLIISVCLTIVALTNCTTSWILVAVLFRLHTLLELPGLPETLAKMTLSTAVAIDITIASTLTYYLHTSRTGIKQPEKVDAVVSSNTLTLQSINFQAAAAGAVNRDSTSLLIENTPIIPPTRKPNILAKLRDRQVRNSAPRFQIPLPALARDGDLERDNLLAAPAPVCDGGVSEGRGDVVPGVATP
ncbi:hypothetical protein CVT25_007685 [Psilocybe cyanescens]|uniref:Uncharacterized protein n=1 Tax=Psilocybe cyanescens TaxID=93625 RepID=A0A409XVM5_PSICY|nr:hypothetical protein CVT25_007685 [Psilocybe cyanescens]